MTTRFQGGVWAWRVLPQLSLGVGLDVLYSSNQMAKIVDQSAFEWLDAKLSFKGSGIGVGGNFGMLLVYEQTNVPDHTLNPGDPDADQHYISLGFGYRPGKWVIDAFYAIGFYVDRKVNNAILSGAYYSLTNLGGVSVGYRF